MVTARDVPPIKASRLVGFLINVAYYTGKLHECSCEFLDLQGETRTSLPSLVNRAARKALGGYITHLYRIEQILNPQTPNPDQIQK